MTLTQSLDPNFDFVFKIVSFCLSCYHWPKAVVMKRSEKTHNTRNVHFSKFPLWAYPMSTQGKLATHGPTLRLTCHISSAMGFHARHTHMYAIGQHSYRTQQHSESGALYQVIQGGLKKQCLINTQGKIFFFLRCLLFQYLVVQLSFSTECINTIKKGDL